MTVPSTKTFKRIEPYDEITAIFGRVPDFFQALTSKPNLLEAFWKAYLEVIYKSSLPEKIKGMIRYEVAKADGCPLCKEGHKDLLRMYGMSDEEICLLDNEVKETKYDDKTKNIVIYSYAVSSNPHIEKKTVDAFKLLGMKEEELIEIASMVHLHRALIGIMHSLGLHSS
jgi:AhpD family alkylhydroperoxidase